MRARIDDGPHEKDSSGGVIGTVLDCYSPACSTIRPERGQTHRMRNSGVEIGK